MRTATAAFGVLLLAGILSAVLAQVAVGGMPDSKGQHALLEYSIAIEGDLELRSGRRDEFYRWSTRRLLEATLEMQAGEPQKESGVFAKDARQSAVAQSPNADYRDLARQMESCQKNDTACQMQLAMKMLGSGYMQQQVKASEDMRKLPKRYQTWHPVKGAKVEAKIVEPAVHLLPRAV